MGWFQIKYFLKPSFNKLFMLQFYNLHLSFYKFLISFPLLTLWWQKYDNSLGLLSQYMTLQNFYTLRNYKSIYVFQSFNNIMQNLEEKINT